MAIKMRSIADIRAWQEAWLPKMGGWLSTTWTSWGSRQHGSDFKELRAQGFFNLKLAPALEELCWDTINDDDDDWTLCFGDNEDEDEDEDESLVQGQQLVNSGRYWVYDESKSAFENRRPELYQNMFG